jgi:hypothetical protein
MIRRWPGLRKFGVDIVMEEKCSQIINKIE